MYFSNCYYKVGIVFMSTLSILDLESKKFVLFSQEYNTLHSLPFHLQYTSSSVLTVHLKQCSYSTKSALYHKLCTETNAMCGLEMKLQYTLRCCQTFQKPWNPLKMPGVERLTVHIHLPVGLRNSQIGDHSSNGRLVQIQAMFCSH